MCGVCHAAFERRRKRDGLVWRGVLTFHNPDYQRRFHAANVAASTVRRILSRLYRRLFPPAAPARPPTTVIVDTDRPPRLPPRLRLDEDGCEHRRAGPLELVRRDGRLYANGDEVQLYVAPLQRSGTYVSGRELRQELAVTPGLDLNANVKDALLENVRLIPVGVDSLFFWGTIAAGELGSSLWVSCLVRGPSGWSDDGTWLGHGWREEWINLDGGLRVYGPAARLGFERRASEATDDYVAERFGN